MSEVYALNYGNCDNDGEFTQRLYKDEIEAIRVADAAARESLDDEFAKQGYEVVRTNDSNGNHIAIITCPCSDGSVIETEWWRVTPMEVY